MHYELLFPNKYLKCADLRGKDVTLTISAIEVEQLQRQGGAQERKPILYFAETAAKAKRTGDEEKRLVLNKTNARTIAGLYGNDTDDWVGRQITLFPTTATFGRSTVDAMRIRNSVPKAKQQGSQPTGFDIDAAVPDDESDMEVC